MTDLDGNSVFYSIGAAMRAHARPHPKPGRAVPQRSAPPCLGADAAAAADPFGNRLAVQSNGDVYVEQDAPNGSLDRLLYLARCRRYVVKTRCLSDTLLPRR